MNHDPGDRHPGSVDGQFWCSTMLPASKENTRSKDKEDLSPRRRWAVGYRTPPIAQSITSAAPDWTTRRLELGLNGPSLATPTGFRSPFKRRRWPLSSTTLPSGSVDRRWTRPSPSAARCEIPLSRQLSHGAIRTRWRIAGFIRTVLTLKAKNDRDFALQLPCGPRRRLSPTCRRLARVFNQIGRARSWTRTNRILSALDRASSTSQLKAKHSVSKSSTTQIPGDQFRK